MLLGDSIIAGLLGALLPEAKHQPIGNLIVQSGPARESRMEARSSIKLQLVYNLL
jgi:hypothetical protein